MFLLTILVCGAAAAPPAAGSTDGALWVGEFSSTQPGRPPAPWRVWDLKGSRETEYRIAQVEGQTVLAAQSLGSASALIRKVDVDPRRYPYLNWTWKTELPVPKGQWGTRENDDFPARIFVIFEKKRGFLSSLGGAVGRIAGGFSGLALNYVWTVDEFAGLTSRSPVSDRVEMIGVESGDEVNWRSQRRNVVEDFEKAFGESPGRIVAVAIMTDTDNTGGRATSYYGDIFFSPEEEAASTAESHPGQD